MRREHKTNVTLLKVKKLLRIDKKILSFFIAYTAETSHDRAKVQETNFVGNKIV